MGHMRNASKLGSAKEDLMAIQSESQYASSQQTYFSGTYYFDIEVFCFYIPAIEVNLQILINCLSISGVRTKFKPRGPYE